MSERRFTRLCATILLNAALLSPLPAIASPHDAWDPVGRFFEFEPATPFNVPDENGCVRICLQDTSPCDPPSFKHTDGRCSQRRRH